MSRLRIDIYAQTHAVSHITHEQSLGGKEDILLTSFAENKLADAREPFALCSTEHSCADGDSRQKSIALRFIQMSRRLLQGNKASFDLVLNRQLTVVMNTGHVPSPQPHPT